MAGFRQQVARWTHEGAPVELITGRIDELPVTNDEKSALWLWARSHRGGRRYEEQRKVLAD